MPSRFEELERGSPQLIFRLKKAMNHEGSELAKEALSAILQLCAELDAMETEVVILDEDVDSLAARIFANSISSLLPDQCDALPEYKHRVDTLSKNAKAVARLFYYPEE